MTTQTEIVEQLKKHDSFLTQTFKIKKIGVFGSYAREQATEANDIDLLVEFYEPIG